MGATFLSFLLFINAADRSDPKVTAHAVRQILENHWNLPAAQVKRQGSSTVSRARTQQADMEAVQLAYGLLLLHHDFPEAAEAVFRRIGTPPKGSTFAGLGLVAAQLDQRKFDVALSSLVRVAQAQPNDPLAAEMAGAFIAYLKAKPPTRPRAPAIESAQDAMMSRWNAEQKARFNEAASAMRKSLDQAPAERDKLLEKPRAVRQEIATKRTMLKNLETALNLQQGQIDTLFAQLQLAATSAVGATNALTQGQTGLSRPALNALAISVIAANNANVLALNQALEDAKARFAKLTHEHEELAWAISQLDKKATALEQQVEATIRRPKLPFSADSARQRLLADLKPAATPGTAKDAAPSAPPAVTKKAEPAGSQAEKKAESLFSLAASLEKSGNPHKASEYYRRIVQLYPESKPAEAARDALLRLKTAATPSDGE